MRENKRLFATILEIAIGIVLAVCSFSEVIDDYWGGMGTALVVVGSIFFFRQLRYKTDESYKDKVDLEINDERNKYLRIKAWSWAGYLFVVIAAFGSIIFKILGMDIYFMAAGIAVCLLTTLYWISYFISSRKY